MYVSLQKVFCNGLSILLQKLIHPIISCGAYFCPIEKSDMMENKFNFADFYEQCYSVSVAYARLFVGNVEDARDIVGDAYLCLMEREGKIDENLNVRALFISMVRNKCLDFLRRRQCFMKIYDNIRLSADKFSERELDELYHKELFRILSGCLSELPKKTREAFIEVRREGKTCREVALQFNVSRRVVEYRVHKAVELISYRLRQNYG